MRFPLAAVLLLLPLFAVAETRFVEVEVTLRRGPGTDFGISQMVRSGSPVEVLETNRAAGWTRVRIPGGAQGWMLTRYLVSNPAGQQELIAAQQRIDELTQANREVTGERNRLMNESDNLAEELAKLKELSSDSIALEATNKRLQASVERLEQEVSILKEENRLLGANVKRDWFLAGGGVLFLGLLLGLVLPRIQWRRKRSWSDL
jgi:SH3 domain protein